ncbi:MAG: WD40 repeat domain-containing protein [Chlorogloeopsis fritschii C42_A2020_084]|uniref:NACHT and WD repeat domain-containing protein n=1 Tax=Chlorogloeopsis fritschii TaxID=1124 RepID=UPI0019DD4416|nr:WD40 repeat domain-containing protein [Chlorogloeopsis fritschii]MBF2009491.1 WD40 repeat domain-containing protein [Chlorogloeopsis fritschii C42_A2020_084]
MSDSGFLEEDRSIKIQKDAISSAIISGDGNKVVIYQYQLERQVEPQKTSQIEDIGPNPYKGLLAFQEEDSDRYFGREKQIEKLWNVFRTLHEDTTQPEVPLRLLPILGPSGSGKSSLARAGLIPELARRPLPGKSQARVAVLVPGTHPVEALATVLARIATNDQTPVAKTREFAEELKRINDTNLYDGLRRIANVLPEIAISPLVVLVDQFEELYSLCNDLSERQIFIENLINAASDRSGCVSVIITLRSDFLGETQRNPALNQVIAKQGVIVPAMSKEELRRAITKPAKIAGYLLDEAVVNLLLKDTEGREGALPLLQFALTRIWEGLRISVEPIKTLEQIGGVGGALADEAQRIYQSLNQEEKKIAQRVFLGLVQLGEGTSDTRRRTNIHSLVSYKDEPERVRKVIGRFTHPGVRLLTLSSLDGKETAEVTHEALFANWGQMREWLDSSRGDIRFQRRLDEAARIWDENERPEGNLWRNPDLNLLGKYYERASDNMTTLQVEFFNASVNAEEARNQAAIKAEQERKRQRQVLIGVLSTGLLLTTTTAGFAAYQWQSAERRRIEQTAITAKNLLSDYPLQGMVSAISLVGQSRSPFLNFPNQSFPQPILDSLFSAVEISREENLLKVPQGYVSSIAISTDGQTIISGGEDGTVRMWNRKGQPLGEPFKGHQVYVSSVAISTDGQTIISGGQDGTVRMWNRKGQPLGEPFKGHLVSTSVLAVAISVDGQTIISGGQDGTVRMWNRKGQPLGEPFKGHQGVVESVAISPDGQTIISGGSDGTIRMWNRKGQPLGEPLKGHPGGVSSVAISPDGQIIISGGEDGTVRIWNCKGQPLGEPLKGHRGEVKSVAISPDGQTIISAGQDGTVRMWDIRLDTWLKTACERLRDHPVFKKPESADEKNAKETCEPYFH